MKRKTLTEESLKKKYKDMMRPRKEIGKCQKCECKIYDNDDSYEENENGYICYGCVTGYTWEWEHENKKY